MSLSDDIRAMVVEKEEQYKQKMEQQQLDAEEKARLSEGFQEQFTILLDGVIFPKLREVASALSSGEYVEAAVQHEQNRVELTFSSLLHGGQFTVTVYAADTVRGVGIHTGSSKTPDDFKSEQYLKLSEVTPEWLDSYLSGFIKQAFDAGGLIY